jgi:hypothetical protein
MSDSSSRKASEVTTTISLARPLWSYTSAQVCGGSRSRRERCREGGRRWAVGPSWRRRRRCATRCDVRAPSRPPAPPAEEIPASRHDVAAPDTRGRVPRVLSRRRALKLSRPRPVRPALPSHHASQAVATRAARAVAKDTVSQAVATHPALLHGSRAVPSQAQMKHGESVTHRRRTQRGERGGEGAHGTRPTGMWRAAQWKNAWATADRSAAWGALQEREGSGREGRAHVLAERARSRDAVRATRC